MKCYNKKYGKSPRYRAALFPSGHAPEVCGLLKCYNKKYGKSPRYRAALFPSGHAPEVCGLFQKKNGEILCLLRNYRRNKTIWKHT